MHLRSASISTLSSTGCHALGGFMSSETLPGDSQMHFPLHHHASDSIYGCDMRFVMLQMLLHVSLSKSRHLVNTFHMPYKAFVHPAIWR